MTESIEVLNLVLSGEMVEYHGEIFDFDPLIARPAPRTPVKILIGGHHEPSLRRAAQLADGWIAGPITTEELSISIERLRQLREECGRNWSDFEIHARPAGTQDLEDYQRLESLGVTDASTLPIAPGEEMDASTYQRLAGKRVTAADDPEQIYSTAPPQRKIAAVHRFAEAIIDRW
jgi:alkanesulfonate monooxygenase SsuD/methylene tetrahydromethanopterin reductase-like flavin-dependent oxidoreductase (luciferase family)